MTTTTTTTAAAAATATADKQRTIVLFGAGFVSTTVIEYLTRPRGRPAEHQHQQHRQHLIIVTRTASAAHDKIARYAHTEAGSATTEVIELDIEKQLQDEAALTLTSVISRCRVAISLVPYVHHVQLARICIAQRVHLVTTSYISPEMRALDSEARAAGVMLLNEIGVDPGTDHLSAIKIIREAEARGDKIDAFYSWCGGLPAPEVLQRDENKYNPLKYKFSWSAAGVLRALNNTATYLENGQVVTISADRLMFDAVRKLELSSEFEFEGYPNRDSTPYMDIYGLQEHGTRTLLRGTLRFQGFTEAIKQFRKVGLLDFAMCEDTQNAQKTGLTWNALLKKLLGAADTSLDALCTALLERLEIAAGTADAQRVVDSWKWLGLLSGGAVAATASYGESLAALLLSKMAFQPGERDMVFLQHTFGIIKADGKRQTIKSTLVLYGDEETNGFSAMAKGTGLPCAVATQMILDGRLTRLGVWGPFYYEEDCAILDELEKVGIKFVEETIDHE